METVVVERAPADSGASPETGPDPVWRDLYRAGAVAATLFVLLVIVPVVLINIAPLPPSAGGAAVLQYIAAHKGVYIAELVSFVGLSLPALIVFLALFEALQPLSKGYAAVGALIGGRLCHFRCDGHGGAGTALHLPARQIVDIMVRRLATLIAQQVGQARAPDARRLARGGGVAPRPQLHPATAPVLARHGHGRILLAACAFFAYF